MDTLSEQQARSLRNYVFEIPTTDNNWSHCKDSWMRPDAFNWLVIEAAIKEAREAKKKHA